MGGRSQDSPEKATGNCLSCSSQSSAEGLVPEAAGGGGGRAALTTPSRLGGVAQQMPRCGHPIWRGCSRQERGPGWCPHPARWLALGWKGRRARPVPHPGSDRDPPWPGTRGHLLPVLTCRRPGTSAPWKYPSKYSLAWPGSVSESRERRCVHVWPPLGALPCLLFAPGGALRSPSPPRRAHVEMC